MIHRASGAPARPDEHRPQDAQAVHAMFAARASVRPDDRVMSSQISNPTSHAGQHFRRTSFVRGRCDQPDPDPRPVAGC
jgi:hypothetical protein